jgi:hypothetical protein
MADEKKVESTVVTLVAVERGFRNGVMVEPGVEFPFNTVDANGKQRKLPKWALRKGDPALSKHSEKPKNGDLKPKAAQVAAKEKAGVLSNDLAG